jgi:hypothetical protein
LTSLKFVHRENSTEKGLLKAYTKYPTTAPLFVCF